MQAHFAAEPFNSKGNCLNGKLALMGNCFVTTTGSYAHETDTLQMYNLRFKAVPADQTDLIYFIKQVSPIRFDGD